MMSKVISVVTQNRQRGDKGEDHAKNSQIAAEQTKTENLTYFGK
jgi:hypothetical protein